MPDIEIEPIKFVQQGEVMLPLIFAEIMEWIVKSNTDDCITIEEVKCSDELILYYVKDKMRIFKCDFRIAYDWKNCEEYVKFSKEKLLGRYNIMFA